MCYCVWARGYFFAFLNNVANFYNQFKCLENNNPLWRGGGGGGRKRENNQIEIKKEGYLLLINS